MQLASSYRRRRGETPLIANRAELLSHGNRAGREIVLDVLEAGLRAPDPYEIVRQLVRIEDRKLVVGHPDFSRPPGLAPLVFDLSEIGSIWVVGGGKAAQRQAEALEDALGDRITGGQINAKKGDSVRLERIHVTLAGHPLPDEDSVEGARRILEIERSANEGDVVFLCASGGATALTALPVPGVSLEDLREVFRVLYIEGGANMPAANAVRNHLALMNGKHPRYVNGATLIELHTVETPPKLRVHLYERPEHVDAYRAAIDVLKTYRCWEKVPESVRAFLLKADPRYGPLRPDELVGKHYYYFRTMGPEYMLEAARGRAEELGLRAAIVASSLSDVEARPVGETLGYVAHEAEVMGRPIEPPCVLLCGGELVVTVGDETGVGGRNQEFVLAAAPRIAGSRGIVIASADSDGADGATDAAGGVVDGDTLARAREAGIDLLAELARHNSHPVLAALGDTIQTGVKGTNVRDLRVIYVGSSGTSRV